jgi:hypothetical protein
MRYSGGESPFAVGILPAAGTVKVYAVNQNTNALLALTSDVAALCPVPPDSAGLGVWQWSLANVASPPAGFTQIVIVFYHVETGARDYCKITVKGILDVITKTHQLVSTTV